MNITLNTSLSNEVFEQGIRQQFVTLEHCQVAIQSANENMRDTYIFIIILIILFVIVYARMMYLQNKLNRVL